MWGETKVKKAIKIDDDVKKVRKGRRLKKQEIKTTRLLLCRWHWRHSIRIPLVKFLVYFMVQLDDNNLLIFRGLSECRMEHDNDCDWSTLKLKLKPMVSKQITKEFIVGWLKLRLADHHKFKVSPFQVVARQTKTKPIKS